MELNEKQFGILKELVSNGVFFIMLPDILESDPEFMHKNHQAYLDLINPMVEMGFIDNITDKFKETVDELRADRDKAIAAGLEDTPFDRGFQAFVLTETAVRMFAAPEGSIN